MTLRVLSSFLLSSLLLQQFAFADPDLKPLDLFRNEKLSTRFSLPESAAWVEDSYKAPASVGGRAKTVYLIQDAHTNVSGQLNIAKTLEAIMNAEPVRTVYLEAGSDRESLESIRGEGLGAEQERAALGYLRRGELQGVEYHNLFSKRSYQMRGVEDPMLYKEALEAYRAVVHDRDRFQAYLDRVEAAIKILKPRIYNSHLLRFDSQREASKNNNNALTDSLISMLEEAARQDIRMELYPHLLAFSKLKDLEARISFKKADEEQARAIALLSEGAREELMGLSKETTHAFKISSSGNGELSGYFARLGSLLGEDLKNYPELSKYLAYLKTAKKIDLRAVLAEERSLEAELYEALSRTEDEKMLSRCAKNASLLRKILRLSATPEDYTEYQRGKNSARIANLTGFLNQMISELGEYYENALFIEPGYEEAIRTGERFYELTRQRDEFFINEMARAMDAANETHSVLVVGGYHAANLKNILKAEGISYVSIVPQIYHETNFPRYEKLLLGQNISQALGARVSPGHLMLGRLGEGAWDPLNLRPKFQSDMKAAGARLAGDSIIGRLESAIGTDFRDKEILARLSNPTENKSKNKFAQIFGDAIFKLSFIDYALGRRAQIGEANLEPFRKYVQSKKWKERILDSIDEDLYETYQRSSVQPYTAESLAGSLMGALIVDGRDLGTVKETADTFLKKYFERALHTLEPVNVRPRPENDVHGDYLEEIEELSDMLEPYMPRETSARSILASKIKPANSRLFPLDLAEEARLGDAIISVIVYAELWKKFGFAISYESLGRIHDHIVGDPNLSKVMIHWSDPDAPKTRLTHREAKYEASLFEALVSAVYEASGGAQGQGFEAARNLIFSELQEYLREGGSIGYEGAEEFVHSVDIQGARLADGSRRKKSQTADARAVEFYKFNRELIRLFTEFNDTKKSGRSEDASKVIDAVRDYSPLLGAYIQEIREADKAGQAVLDSFASRSREELKEISQKLAEQVRSFAPNFEAAHIIRDQNELDRLNREVLPLLKQRLKIQLIRLRSELRAAKIAQGPVFMILASVIGLYRRISYEHTWADRRLRGQEILSRFQMGDATGHLVFNLFYEKEPVIRVERKSDGKIKLSQIIWKYVDVSGGKQALKPVLTPIGFEALEKAFRSRIHALVSQEEEFAQLVYHDLALQDAEQTLESYQSGAQGLPVYPKDQIQHSIESVLEGPGGKRGLRRKYASVKDQKGDVLPMPGPTLEAAAVSVGSGDLKTALQLVRSAREYIDRRMTAIERTKDATVRKRDYVYLLIRDQALLSALKNLKSTLEAKPLELEKLDSAAMVLHSVWQTYYQALLRDPEYKRTRRMIQSYLAMIQTLESQVASSGASGKEPILLPGFISQVDRAIQTTERSIEDRHVGARLALKEYIETSEYNLVEAGRVVQKALALPPLTLMNIHASLEDYLENLSDIRSRFNGIYFDDPALLAMEVLDPLAHLRFSMVRFLVISRAFPPLAEIKGKSPSGILMIEDHTDTFVQHMANATLSVLTAHDWAQKVSGKLGARLALESAASILLWEVRQADKKAFARAAWDALGSGSISAPLFVAPWRKVESSLERLSVLSSYDTLPSASLLESFRVVDLVASHLLERGLDYGFEDPDLYESADRYLKAYFEYVLLNGAQVRQGYESVRSDDPKLLEALKEYYENDYDYLSGARLSHEDELEDNLSLLAQAIYEGRESASKVLAIARGHFRQGLKGLDPNPFSRAQMHRHQENYHKALLVAISSAFRKGEWDRYVSWRYEFITHFSEEDPAFRVVDQGVDPELLDKVFDMRSTTEWMDHWSGIRELQELLLSGARLATDDRENDFKKIRKGLTFFAREAETLIVELSLEGTGQPKVTERFLEDLEYLEERLREIQDVVLWEEKEKTYEIFTDIWQTLIVLEESKDLLGKRLDAVHIEKLFTAWARNAGPSYELRVNVFFASYYTQMALRLVTGQELLKDLNGFLKTKSSVIHLYSTMITEIDDYVVLTGADDPSGWKRLRRRLPEWLRAMDRFEAGVHSAKKYYRKGAFEKIFYDDSDLRKAGDYLVALSGSVDRALDEKSRGARLAFDRIPSFESEISQDPPDSRQFANALRPLHEALGNQHIEYPSLNGTEGKIITALVHGYALLVGMPYIAMPLARSFKLVIHWEAYDLEALKNRDMRLVEAAIHNWTNFPEANHSRQMNFVIQQLFKYLEHHDAYVRSVAYVILKELGERMALLKDTMRRTVSVETGAIDPSLAYQGRVNGGRDSDFDDINDPNRYKVWSSGARLATSAAEKKTKIERTVHTLWASKRKFGDFKNLAVPYVIAKVPGMGELLSRLSKIRQTGQRNEIFGELFAMDFIAENILKDAAIVGTNLFIGPSEVDVVFLNTQGLWVVEAKEFFNHDVDEQIKGVVTGQAADQAKNADYLRRLGIPVFHIVVAIGKNVDAQEAPALKLEPSGNGSVMYSLKIRRDVEGHNAKILPKPTDRQMASLAREEMRILRLLEKYATDHSFLSFLGSEEKIAELESDWKNTIEKNRIQKKVRRKASLPKKLSTYDYNDNTKEANGWISSFQRAEVVSYDQADISNARDILKDYFDYALSGGISKMSARFELQNRFNAKPAGPFLAWKWLENGEYREASVVGARLASWNELSLGERQELLKRYAAAPLDDEAITLLIEGLKENFRAIFSEAEKIMVRSNDPRIAKRLLEAFEDRENEPLYFFRARAAQVLSQIHPVSQRTVHSLIAATKDPHAKVAAASVEALGRIDSRDPLIVKSLWEASRSRRATVRQAAKKILDTRSREQSASGARLAGSEKQRDPDTVVDLSGREADLYALRIFRDSYLVKFEQKIDAGHSAEEALKKMDDMFGEKGDRKKRLETLSYLVYGEILTERELTLRIDQRKAEDLYVLKSLNRALNVVFKRAQRHGGKFTFKKLAQTYQSYLERHNKAQNAAPTEADTALLNRILNFVEGKMPLNAKVSKDVRIAVTDAMDDSKLGAAGVTNLSSVAKGEKLREALAQLKPHILVVRSATKVDEALIDKLLPDLKAIIRGGHGLDNVDADYARLMGVEVYGTQGSEHAVAAWALRAIAAAQQQGLRYKEDAAPQSFFTIPEWTQALEKKTSKEKDEAKRALLKAKGEDLFVPVSRDTIESLKGKTIGIIGFGAVGRNLAAAAKELGMRVLVNTPTLEKDPLPALKAGYEAASKEAIYKTSHYIVPLTGLYLTGPRKNSGMIGQAEVDLMLQNDNLIALVNPDREGLVDEMAITRLMVDGRVQYLADEVPDSDYLAQNARYTPHIAASTKKAEEGVVQNTAALLARIYPEVGDRIQGARLAKEDDPSLVSTQIIEVRDPKIHSIDKRIRSDGGFELLFKKSEILKEAFKDALDDFDQAVHKDRAHFFGKVQDPSQEHYDIAFVDFIRQRSQASPDILEKKFQDTSDWFLRAFSPFAEMTFDKVFSEQSRSRILYDESDEGPLTEAKRYLAGYFLKKGLAEDREALSETSFSELVPAILALSRSALIAEKRLFMKIGAHPAIQTAILVDKLGTEPTFASFVEGVLRGARLAEKDPLSYKIRLEDQGEGRWISVRDERDGKQTRFEFQAHRLSDYTPEDLKDRAIAVYMKLADRLDLAEAKLKLLYTDPRRGNDTIFLTHQNRVAALYNLSVKDGYLIGFVVDRDFRGTGAADVLLEEMVQRHLGGDRTRQIKGVITRDSDRAQAGRFRGTVDLFKSRLGMRSAVTVVRERSSKPVTGARLSYKKDSIRFLANVYDAQKREGEIALGAERLKIAVRPDDRALLLYGLGERPVAIRNYRLMRSSRAKDKNISVDLSVSELRQALGQDTQAVDAALDPIDTRVPVVAAIDLGAFSTPDSKETIFPLLVRELHAARRQNAVFTLKGSVNEVDAVLNEASKLYGEGQDFIYRQGEDLPEAFQDARRVVISGASAAQRGDVKNERLLLVKNLERGELPNLKAILKTALFEARVEKLESTDPQFVRLLNAYRILLGNREISNVAEFITVLEGSARDLSILQKYIIAPKPIAYDAVLRVYALMIKMAEQSA